MNPVELAATIDETLYFSYVKHFRKYVYIRIPKTGSTSIITFLKARSPHKTAAQTIQRIGLPSWEKKFTFTFVRNPFARVVSTYFSFGPGMVCDSKTHFRAWAKVFFAAELHSHKSVLTNRQTQWDYIASEKCGGGGGILVDFVGKLETVEADLAFVCKRLNKPFTAPIPHENASIHKRDYREYYDDETREVVARWFGEDLQQFGYDFDGLKM